MPIKYRAATRKDGCRTVFAYDGKEKVGWIGACASTRYLEVQKVHVVDSHRRRKIATGLYEHIARTACEIGKPLASYGWQRNAYSEGFWEKQLRLDRAQYDARETNLTILKCPVTSLAGQRGKRR